MDASIRTWAPHPPTVRATAGAIDVCRADLAALGDRPEQLLSDEESARAARILPERKRVLWARSRGVLRELLGRYLDRDPRTLDFVLGPHGKPALASDEHVPVTDLRFNLSHSGGLALYAVTVGHEVGVDIERARARYTAELIHAWVVHEAEVKCLGLGLAAPAEGRPRGGLWTTQLDFGTRTAAAVTVEGGRCEVRSWEWRA